VWVTSQSREHPGAVVDAEFSDDGGRAATENGDGRSSIVAGLIGATTTKNDGYCAVAARNVTTGAVLWRANACSSGVGGGVGGGSGGASGGSSGFVPRHATLASVYLTVYTLDDAGILRGWNAPDGSLVLDADVLSDVRGDGGGNDNNGSFSFPGGVPRLLDATLAIGTVATNNDDGGDDDESLVLLDAGTGKPIKEEGYHHQHSSASLLSAKTLLTKAKLHPKKNFGRARILDMRLIHEESGTIAVFVGWTSSNDKNDGRTTSTLASVAVAEVALTPKPAPDGRIVTVYRVVRTAALNLSDSASGSAAASSVPFSVSSLRTVRRDDDGRSVSLLAVSSSETQVIAATVDVSTGRSKYGSVMEIDAIHPYWRSIASIHVDNTRAAVDEDAGAGGGSAYRVVTVAGLDDRYPVVPRRTESLLLLDGSGTAGSSSDIDFHRVHGPSKNDEEIHQDSIAYCAEMGMVIAATRPEGGETLASAYSIGSDALTRGGKRVTWSPMASEGDDAAVVPRSMGGGTAPGLVKYAHLVECSKEGATVAFTTLGGMTTAFRFDASGGGGEGKVVLRRLWSSEEALGSVSSAIFLDETHAMAEPTENGNADDDDEEETALRNLEFSHRIRSQLSSLQNFVLGGGALSSLTSLAMPSSDEKRAERGVAFGFAKISVLLSEKLHRVVALDTARGGRAVWSTNLHPRASWHKLVHGGQLRSLNDPHGNGGVHDHEILALSHVVVDGDGDGGEESSVVEWQCMDGTTGRVFSSDAVSAKSSIVQIVPLRTSSHHPHDAKSCRQVVLLVHSDRTVSVVPDTARSYVVVDEAISSGGPNGLFVHTIDETSGEFHALRVAKKSGADSFELIDVGTAIFDPSQERIVNVAYPRRGEVIQSPSTVLGDDALLLKYLNPHLMVVVTEATPSFLAGVAPVSDGSDETGNGFYNALVGGEYGGASLAPGQKRKPLGATKPGADASSSANASPSGAATPSLFVSLVDSVSGQILHRVSHAHALASDLTEGAESMTRVPVVISENWVVYTFFNQRTRRTDVGVLTLHEGMIDKNGITAFSAPEQELSFSSLESAKPIVLSKTYGIAKAITALGVTTTKAGISSKQFLFATANDQVISIDRRFLDPRRPNGELKESEKMEGLMRYAPILPINPLRTPSHVYEVSSVQSISSASANVESQSLVIAYGGPDVFFTRLAPSKAFDLLPDDFNRGLLSAVVVGLIIGLNVIQRMNKKKMVTTVWS